MSFDLDRTSREVLEHATGSRETITVGQDALGEVALTWLLMSSPTIGRPAAANFAAHLGSEAMKTGRALTKATRRGPR